MAMFHDTVPAISVFLHVHCQREEVGGESGLSGNVKVKFGGYI